MDLRELRREHGMPSPAEVPLSEMEFELVWALHASIFYIGIRKWIYGLEIPENVDEVVENLATSFLDGVPAVMQRALAPPSRYASSARAAWIASRSGSE